MEGQIRLTPVAIYGADYIAEFDRVLNRYLVAKKPRVLEWGAGYTTSSLLAYLDSVGCEMFVTIDDNEDYLRDVLRDEASRPWFHAICEAQIGDLSQTSPMLTYSTRPLLFGKTFDFVFIDGRRRLECAFIASLMAHKNTIVVLHDYRRGRYQPIRALFDVLEEGPQFLVLKARRSLVRLFEKRARAIVADVRGLNGHPPPAGFLKRLFSQR